MILKALAKNPQERFASIEAFATALDDGSQLANKASPHVEAPLVDKKEAPLLKPRPTPPRRDSPPIANPPPHPRRLSRRVAFLLSLLALLIILGSAVGVYTTVNHSLA